MEAHVWQAFTFLTAPTTERLTFFLAGAGRRGSAKLIYTAAETSPVSKQIIFNGIEVLKIIGRVSAPKICPDVALVTSGRLCSNSQNTHGPVAQR
jgi:hypothetical protein